MSDNLILATLARLEAGQDALADRMDRLQAGQERLGAVLDRTEAKVDKLTAELAHPGPRMSQIEADFSGQYVRSASASNRLDALDVRLTLIERRLELRDPA